MTDNAEIDLGKAALYILTIIVPRHENVKRKIEHLLTATKLMEKTFMEAGRVDLRDRTQKLQDILLANYMINWDWMHLYSRSPYLPAEAQSYLKELNKRLAKIEAIRLALMDLLLDIGIIMKKEEIEVEPATIGWDEI